MIGNPAAWTAVAAIIGIVITLAAGGARVAVLMARLVDQVRDLNGSMKQITSMVSSNEARITKLEAQRRRGM